MRPDLEILTKLVDDVWELVFGKERRPEKKFEGMYMKQKPKRARGKKGKFLADNKMTKDFNEAWVGGKAPKKRKKND